MDPKALRRWLVVVAVVYLVLPRDLLFDFAGRGLGFADDLALAALLYWYYRKRQRDMASGRPEEEPRRERTEAPPSPGEAPRDPHEVLGIPATASADEVQSAYRARMREYHPDKVAHLGEELQKLAHRKAQEIQEAYETLRK